MRVLIASGGTGGHIFPALAVGEEIARRKPGTQLLLMGVRKSALKGVRFGCGECTLPAQVVHLPAVGMPRKLSIDLPSFACRLLVSFDQSLRQVARFRPHVAVGFGNFGSFAPLLAAKVRGVPIAIHEANAVPGRANLLLSRLSDEVLVNFSCTARHFRLAGQANGNVQVVGMPLRREFAEPRDRFGALAKLRLSSTKFTLLVVGGSQGARALNVEMCNALSILQRLSNEIQIIHLTGKSDYPWVRRRYRGSSLQASVVSFDPHIKGLYDAADLVVARAGASTIAEIIQTGKPALLVPFPYATARHQERNAKYLEQNNGAVVLRQQVASPGRTSIPGLGEKLRELIEHRDRLQRMAENNLKLANGSAARSIVDWLFKIARPEVVVVHGLRGRVPGRAGAVAA